MKTKTDLTKEELLKMINNFEYYPAVTENNDKEYIVAYLEDEACAISQEEIQTYLSSLKRTYRVPFQTREEIWMDNIAMVQATSKEEAYASMQNVINTSGINPYSEFNSDWVGLNQGIDTTNDTYEYGFGDDYNSPLEKVEEYFILPMNKNLSSDKQAELTPKKTINLEISTEILDVDIASILEGLDADNDGYSFSGSKVTQYKLKTLADTLNPDFNDKGYEDPFGEKWNQFVGYCKQEMVDYITLTTHTK